jgi:hypothetical protein
MHSLAYTELGRPTNDRRIFIRSHLPRCFGCTHRKSSPTEGAANTQHMRPSRGSFRQAVGHHLALPSRVSQAVSPLLCDAKGRIAYLGVGHTAGSASSDAWVCRGADGDCRSTQRPDQVQFVVDWYAMFSVL